MDRNLDLPTLYRTKEFADCTLIALNGGEFLAHRVVVGQSLRLKDLVAGVEGQVQGRRVQLHETAEVVERMLQWMYGITWAENVQTTTKDKAKELVHAMGVADAAEKYEIPKMANDAHAMVGRAIRLITTTEDGLRVLRETSVFTATGALQRTIIDRALDLLPKDECAPSPQNRGTKRGPGANAGASSVDFDKEDSDGPLEAYPKVIKIPKRSGRPPKPTEKGAPRKLSSQAPPASVKKSVTHKSESEQAKPILHCVCRVPEDMYLVQCEKCEKWFHPGCIGKGLFTESTYQLQQSRARGCDEERFRDEDANFSCTECDAVAASEG